MASSPFLNLLSILAFVTTVGLFFCGIPICRQIWKRRDTAEISGAPFLMGVLGGTCWCVYGYLKKDHTVMYVTGAQIVLYSIYTVFYWFMTKKKLMISIKVATLVAICASLVALVHFFDHKVFHPLGIICMTLNTMDFAAPLAGLKVVIRRRATSTLPLPLCIANFLVSSEWFVYGLLVWDFYLITPNGIGSFLAFCQLILFAVLPRKPLQRAPILRLIDFVRNSCCCCCIDKTLDLESAAVVTAEKKSSAIDTIGIHRMSSRMSNKHRWSSRMITNVVGEVENVIQKVHGDQFGYKLNKEDEEGNSTDSGTLTPVDEKPTTTVAVTAASGGGTVQLQGVQSGTPEPERKMEDEEQLDIDDVDDDDDQSEEDGEHAEYDGTAQDGIIAADLAFPLTIRDPEQLLRLSRQCQSDRLKLHKKQKMAKKGGSGMFGGSLQTGHFRAMRRHAQQSTNADGLPTIDELSTQLQQHIKRAASAPNICEEAKTMTTLSAPVVRIRHKFWLLQTAVKHEERGGHWTLRTLRLKRRNLSGFFFDDCEDPLPPTVLCEMSPRRVDNLSTRHNKSPNFC
uniref:Sugar transporter SWEET1 n=1 Tax=Globodera rostochiensis TaxID=31243 RepID=A0A914I3N8_GLORO